VFLLNAIYVRVSTDAQAETGYSIGDQVRTCRAHAEKLGSETIAEYIDDGYSGEYIERPALDRLRSDLRAKLITNVIVYDPDRLSRNLTNQLIIADDIEKAGANLIFITHDYDASPEGKMFFSIRGAISAFEKAKIRERTMRGKRSKALSGKLVFDDGLYGYDYDKEKSMYTINEDEAKNVRTIFDLYTTRGYGATSLWAEIKALGLVSRNGKPFILSTLNKMLCNETYSGTKKSFRTHNKAIGQKKRQLKARDESEWISIPVPPIISQETWDKAVECRSLNKVTAKRNRKHEYLLSNIIRCAGCGYALHGVNYRRGDKEYPYYICTAYINNNECAIRKCIPQKELDDAVWADLTAAAKKKNGLSAYQDKPNEDLSTRGNLEIQLVKLIKRQKAILKWVSDGAVESDAADPDIQNIHKEITAIKTAMSALSVRPVEKVLNTGSIIKAKTFAEKRQALLQNGILVFAKKINGVTSYSIKV